VTVLGANPGVVRDILGYLGATVPSSPDTFYRANMSRIGVENAAAALTTQVMTAVPVFLNAGDLVTNLTFLSGGTAAGTPTNYWFALYDNAATPALLAQTADQLTAAWAANTAKTLALSAPVRIQKTGIYWAVCMVKATTVPSLIGATCARPILSGEKNLAVTSGSALVGTAPATLAAPAVQDFAPLVVVT
jgi:hypothetical protein